MSTPRIEEVAALEFLGAPVDLTLLADGPSRTYRVTRGSERFVLRVNDLERPPFEPGYYDRVGLESECLWLEALARDTDLVVPEPLPAPGGGHVVEVRVEDRAEPVPCILTRWVEGEVIDGQRAPEQARKLGELLVALHEHSEAWTPPARFVRPAIDRRWTREAVRRLQVLAAEGVYAPDVVAVLAEAVDRLVEELAPVDEDPRRRGLIHADLHESNYVVHADELRPIDFARCGWGTWLNDLAESLQHLYPDRRRNLVEAYSHHRPLDDGDVRRLEGNLVGAAVEVYGYHSPDPEKREEIARSMESVAGKHVRRYLEGRPFLFEL